MAFRLGSIEKSGLDDISHGPSTSASNDDFKSEDTDAAALAQMGYTQDLKRNYTWFSLLGVGFALTNSWWGISAALITGINSGGPVQIVYGLILFALISTCVGISLSELASALPNAGGQYFVSRILASSFHPFCWYSAKGCCRYCKYHTDLLASHHAL